MRTRSSVFKTFVSYASPRVITAFAVALVAVRVLLGNWGRGDLIVAVITLLTVGLFEWVVHLVLLHAPEDSIRMQRFGTGSGHRRHHLDPTDMDWVLLSKMDTLLFCPAFAVFSLWTLPVGWISGASLLHSFVTGWALAIIGLLHYEWTHLLVHTSYRPKTRFYKRLARNHRLHHYRNENYWLGVTSNMGDRVLRTLPKDKSAVPVSDTARSLG